MSQIWTAIRENGWGTWVELLPMPRNGGFAYGNNGAIARARQLDPDLAAVVLLNPDAVVRPGGVVKLLQQVGAQPSAGAARAAIEGTGGGLVVCAHPLYYEEVDFCRRARRAGWSCWLAADARVMHLEGAATGIKAAGQRRPPYWFASRRRFFVKAYGIGGLVLADLLWALGRTSLVLRRALGLGGEGL